MQSNPFVEGLKVAAFAILAFVVFLAFWQRRNLEDNVTTLRVKDEALADRVAEMSRKVDDLKEKADRVQGAADALSKMLASGARVVSAGDDGASSPGGPSIAAATSAPGALDNVTLDTDVDPSRPVGTPGRYKNFLALDPDPEIPPESKGHDDGVVGETYGTDPKGFNFITESEASLHEKIMIYVADTPANEHWKDPYQYAPSLCWRIEVSPDFKEYTLFFRKDAVWQTPPLVDLSKYPHLRGTHPVTARDYKFTVDMIRNPQSDCAPLRAYYSDVESVELKGDYTAVVRWKETLFHTIGYTLTRQVMPEFLFAYGEDGKRFPEETIGQQFSEHFYNQVGVCGSGPYRMVSYQRGQWITLERNEDWWGIHDGIRYPVKTKKLLIYIDSETPFLKLQAGEIDITGLGSYQWKSKILDDKDPKSPFVNGTIEHYKALRPVYMYFGWKNTTPLFRDRNVRKAMALACNRDEIIEKIHLGHYMPMSSPIFPQSRQADPDLKPLPFDLAEARRILDAAGWTLNPKTGVREKDVDGAVRRFQFKIMWTAPNPEVEATLNQYKNDLLSIGVVMEPTPFEWTVMQKKLHDRDFEAYVGSWSGDSWDHDFEQLWTSRQIQDPGSSNYVEFSNAELDRLSDDLRREMDVDKRIAKVRRIGRILYTEQPYCFFGWLYAFGAHYARLKNTIEHTYLMKPFIRTFPMYVVK